MKMQTEPANERCSSVVPRSILFVENDLLILRIYGGYLRDQGYQVEVANDGRAALNSLKRRAPGAVILDLHLPKVNGIEVLKQIRSQPALAKLPVIVFSTSFMGKWVDDAWKAGATKCLAKGCRTPKQLCEILDSILVTVPKEIAA
jgi:CheY-like chemotaxis protein